jgi:hypothetical protein
MMRTWLRRSAREGLERRERRTRVRPELEGLEGRLLLYSTTGGSWPAPVRVTYSIVPDGTSLGAGAGTSNLVSALNAKFPTSQWVGVFQQAAAIWEQVANINLVGTSDNGAPLNSGPDVEGDPNMGDIRIFGSPTVVGNGALAFTFLPPPINGSSAAGDVIMNTSSQWNINSNYDLLTVAIHEFGYALGMGPSQVQSAVMYGSYTGLKQGLTSDDVQGIDSIYQPRQPDAWIQTWNNTSWTNAPDVTPWLSGNAQIAIPNLSIMNVNTPEWFKLTVPSNTSGQMIVSMQSLGLSSLSPSVTVLQQYSNGGFAWGGASSQPMTYGGVASVVLKVSPGQVYYIATDAAGGGATSAGAYGLLVNLGSAYQPFFSPPNTTVADEPGSGGGGYGTQFLHGTIHANALSTITAVGSGTLGGVAAAPKAVPVPSGAINVNGSYAFSFSPASTFLSPGAPTATAGSSSTTGVASTTGVTAASGSTGTTTTTTTTTSTQGAGSVAAPITLALPPAATTTSLAATARPVSTAKPITVYYR